MNTLRILGLLVVAVILSGASCDQSLVGTPPDPTAPVTPTITSLELLASSPQLLSDGSTTVTLSALVKNANNQVVADVPVVFAATSGALAVTEGTTTAQGVATADLTTSGNPTNRTIVVTAAVGELTDTVDVAVIGSTLQIQGPVSLVNGDDGEYIMTLSDAGGLGIPDQVINVSATNTLSAESLTTDINGRATVTLTGSVSGDDTLTASALPGDDGVPTVTASANITVSADNFSFTSPPIDEEVNLGASETVTVVWEKDGNPQVGETIRFATTRGLFDDPSTGPVEALPAIDAVTDGTGAATVEVSSTTSGFAVVTARASDGTSVQRSIEFVATNPTAISVQADPAVIGITETSTITAVVTDPANNRVKDATVEFTVEDSTGGTLSTASAITDSQGRAQTIYTASSVTSADNGVEITATVDGGTNPSTSTNMTVSGSALFINFGTGNTIVENDTDTQYIKDYVLMVTDSSGAGVANQNVTLSVLSDIYRKGVLGLDLVTQELVTVVESYCGNEDQEPLNGVLDPGEDQNHSEFPENTFGDMNADGVNNRDTGFGVLEPGNRALVDPGTVTTDESGLAEFQLIYPQDHALWLDVIITAKATVAGTESKRTQRVTLVMSAEDEENPPNAVSPFGTDYFFQNNCTDEDPGTSDY